MKTLKISFLRHRFFLNAATALLAVTVLSSPIVAQTATTPPTGSFRVRTPDGLSLAAEAQGDPAAPEILLIHGLGQSHLSWQRQLSDPALAGFRIVSFDLRGHGDSDKPEDAAAYSDGARWGDDVAAVIAASGLRRPVMVGWSLGGTALMYYLGKHGTQQVAGINLVAAVIEFTPETLRPASLKFAGQSASEDFRVRSKSLPAFLEACFAKLPPRAELDQMMVINGMVNRSAHVGTGKLSTTGFAETITQFTGPLLVTFGTKDALVFPKMAERVRELNPRAELSIYPESGHSPFYENPERFNRELAALVRSANASSKKGSAPGK